MFLNKCGASITPRAFTRKMPRSPAYVHKGWRLCQSQVAPLTGLAS